MRKFIFGLVALLFASTAFAQVEESVAVGYDYIDDGGCSSAAERVTVQYDRESAVLDAFGNVTVEPSGGNCEVDAVSYNVSVERRFAIGEHWAAAITLGADRRAVGALYGLTDNGMLLTRGDGGPLFASILPAGDAETVTGAFGGRRKLGEHLTIGVGINAVPVDFANGESERTVRFSASADWWDIDADLVVETAGPGTFGEVMLRRDWPINDRMAIRLSVSHAFGLDELDAGVPVMQTVNGAEFVNLGAPSSSRTAFGVLFSVGF